MRLPLVVALSFVFGLILSSCGGSSSDAPGTAPEPSVAPTATPEPTPVPLPPLTVDLHLDTVTGMMSGQVPWTDESLEAPLGALRAAGVDVAVQAAWIPRGVDDPRGVALGKVRRIRAMVEQSHGAAAIVTGPEQLEQVVREGRLAVVISLEGGTALTDGAETLRELHDLGVSMVGLTWSEASPYADSSAEPRPGDAAGLTAAGREMVGLCNDLGILIDVSHMSDVATAQTVQLSRAPVLASHSNARWLTDVPRNLSRPLVELIVSRGGLVGAMFHGPFVVEGHRATRADVVAMTRALVDVGGAGHVGIGSDWDGLIQAPAGLGGPADLQLLAEDLAAAGLSEGQVRSVLGDSFLRLWRAVVAAR